MQLITDEIKGYVANSSMIRRMFEAGIELRKKYGADKVYDFSLGNPDLPPPPEVKQALETIAARADRPFALGYMPNAGYPALREKLAVHLSKEQNVTVPASHVIMTCGAAGGINVFFRAVLEAGDEVICPAPYFVEYGFYAGNHRGRLIPVPSKDFTFELDLDALEKEFTVETSGERSLRLTPLDAGFFKEYVKTVEFEFGPGFDRVERLRIVEKNGDEMEIVFRDVVNNQPIPGERWQLPPPSNAF